LLFALVAVGLLPRLPAQDKGFRPPPNFARNGKADQAEGARILAEFRQAGIGGTYWLGFELRVMPRKGAERTVPGEMLGTRGDRGPLTLLTIDRQRWLVQGGPASSVWQAPAGEKPQPLPLKDALQPVAGTDLTLFDLQMPFLYWKDFVYEGLTRARGRPAHSFVLYPPRELAAVRPDLTGVRVLIDTQFQALMQAELLGAKGTAEKTISVLDLKKVGEQWIVKSIDLHNNLTRDKTRFTVTAAALDLALSPAAFEPAALSVAAPAIPAEKIVRF
jgi:hypothetical protein